MPNILHEVQYLPWCPRSFLKPKILSDAQYPLWCPISSLMPNILSDAQYPLWCPISSLMPKILFDAQYHFWCPLPNILPDAQYPPWCPISSLMCDYENCSISDFFENPLCWKVQILPSHCWLFAKDLFIHWIIKQLLPVQNNFQKNLLRDNTLMWKIIITSISN